MALAVLEADDRTADVAETEDADVAEELTNTEKTGRVSFTDVMAADEEMTGTGIEVALD